jgi:anti-sigma factor RsiW
MSASLCDELSLLIQADIDGELRPAEAARVASHLDACEACSRHQRQLIALSARLRSEAPRHRAPASLQDALRTRVEASTHPPTPRRLVPAASFAAGLALAASLAVVLIRPVPTALPDEAVAAHIRALQPGHLTDVLSTDRHTVKPWFNGRLDFAPPVEDFAASGFALIGGRLDFVAGHTAAVLSYRRRQHIIDLFIWPLSTGAQTRPASQQFYGFNVHVWARNGMQFTAVSDLNTQELADFVRLAQAP